VQKPKSLTGQVGIHGGDASEITARSVEARDQTKLDRVSGDREDNRDRRTGCLGRRCSRWPQRDNDVCTAAHQIGGQFGHSFALEPAPAILDQYIPAFNVPDFAQPFLKAGDERSTNFGPPIEKNTNDRRRRLLCVRRDRQCSCTAEPCDELPPPH
jgi:hypothetical protein